MAGRAFAPLRRRGRSGRYWLAGSAVVLVACLALTGGLQASGGPAKAKDEAATYTYLRAAYAYEKAVDARLARSLAAMQALASRVAGECAGVLAGAPSPALANPSRSPNGRASLVRRLEQRRWLTAELTTALLAAWLAPEQKAAEALVQELASLRWSSHSLTHQAQLDAHGLRELTNGSALDVCSDMRAWAQNGYETLAPATAELREQSRTGSVAGGLTARLNSPLTAYEGRRELALAASVRALRVKEARSIVSALSPTELGLRETLGFSAAEEAEEAASDS